VTYAQKFISSMYVDAEGELTFRHRIYVGQSFPYSPENAFYILVFNQQIYFII